MNPTTEKIKSTLTHSGAVLRVQLDAPPGNVLDRVMIEELRALLRQIATQPIKALVLEGAGENFSYGASIEEHRADQVADMLQRFHALFRELLEFSRPTIAVVRGACLGGGLELASFCTRVIAAPDSRLGLPEMKLAVFPPLGCLLLPDRVGRAMAEELCLTGRILDAHQAEVAHLVDQVADNPAAAAERWIAEHLLPKSATALRFAVQAARQTSRAAFLEGLDALERLYVAELMQTHDAREGIEAFLEKRPPQWKNR
jgi:cyclohexa-1,5-dienecarbonyl-CoA hydratase